MATVSISSTQITNRDASPKVLNNSRIERGMLRSSIGVIETSAADDIGSKYIMCQIPSSARMSALKLSCDNLGSTGTADIGLYQTTENGGAVVDADFFASAQALTSALSNSDVLGEAAGANASLDVSEREQPIWEAAGLTADPFIDYDIVLTVAEAVELAGHISLEAIYVI